MRLRPHHFLKFLLKKPKQFCPFDLIESNDVNHTSIVMIMMMMSADERHLPVLIHRYDGYYSCINLHYYLQL